jgi:hypothetical protein
VYAPCPHPRVRWGLRDRGPNGTSLGGDDSREDILAEKYRGADGVREVDPSERGEGGGRERRRAVDYERDTGGSYRRRCPSRPVPRGTTSLLCGDRCARPRQVGARHRHSEMRSAAARGMADEGTGGLSALNAVATTRSRCRCVWRGRRLRRCPWALTDMVRMRMACGDCRGKGQGCKRVSN